MSVLARFPDLVCPQCRSNDLEERDQLLRCLGCQTTYPVDKGRPVMLAGDLVQFAEEMAVQDRVALDYEAARYSNEYALQYHRWWTDLMLKTVKAEGRILDNGCGIGPLFEQLPSADIVGIDISSAMLDAASKHSDRLIQGNSQSLPFADASFDLAFCRSLLHHLPDPAKAVAEMHRVLRPGGELVLVDPNTSVFSWLPRKLFYHGDHFSDDHENMSRAKLEKLLEGSFVIEECRYFGYLAYPLFGFPDLVDFSKWIPFKSVTYPMIMAFDLALSKIPLVRTLAWAILIKARRRS